jgi:hypothetical protein
MIIYKCDICKNECHKLITINVPVNEYMEARNKWVKLCEIKTGIKMSNIEICSSCATHIADYFDALGIKI